MPSSSCPYELGADEYVYQGRWMNTRRVSFKTKTGTTGVWESAHRIKKPQNDGPDGVDVVATLVEANGVRKLILVRQYRIPCKAWCIEFPAGLVDSNETVEAAAKRELKEETGYTATKIVSISGGVQPLDPGLSDDSCQFVRVEVDASAEENRQPRQQLEPDETCEVVLADMDELLEFCDRATRNGDAVESMVYSFALAVDMTKKMMTANR